MEAMFLALSSFNDVLRSGDSGGVAFYLRKTKRSDEISNAT
jgi:hypothetical protein